MEHTALFGLGRKARAPPTPSRGKSAPPTADTSALLTGQLGHLEKADIIRHGPHKHRRAGLLVLHVPRQAGEGEGRAVGLGHIQPLQHNLSEGAVRPPGKEPEQLHQQSKVHIVRLGRRADLVSDTPATGH